MFVLYDVRVYATVLGVSGQLSGGSDWVTTAWAGQGLANNASMVLGLSSCIACEHAPRID